MNNTIQYYQQNAEQFSRETRSVDFSQNQGKFMSKLKKNDTILDFGCGSGRDTKCFLEHGFQVEAIDGSEELCRLAGEFTGIKVKHLLFQELAEKNKYDGIWACSSILHLPKQELIEVIQKMSLALKSKGIIYTSFKYGTFEGERNGRYFTDMTEDSFEEILQATKELQIEEQWITSDVRPERGNEKWLNLILRKM
ncbi:class I SAM-dependent methyltransferase [Roseburia sp. MSJ-14]|uniref:class I SAM-dependent methyltransferase n=1 Tax=Roseburia sp. MSJ-14 TaxID=2841514 RepID=UPI001C0F77BD|nr:class I SAM-dependent methyltransferase [Roseburia sp. MSJ-14]